MAGQITLQQSQMVDQAPLPGNLGLGGIRLGSVLFALQSGQVGDFGLVANSLDGSAVLQAGSVNDASLRIATVAGTVATAGTPVNTAAVGTGITPGHWWVQTASAGAGAVVSYSGDADGTFSVDATADGAVVTVAFTY